MSEKKRKKETFSAPHCWTINQCNGYECWMVCFRELQKCVGGSGNLKQQCKQPTYTRQTLAQYIVSFTLKRNYLKYTTTLHWLPMWSLPVKPWCKSPVTGGGCTVISNYRSQVQPITVVPDAGRKGQHVEWQHLWRTWEKKHCDWKKWVKDSSRMNCLNCGWRARDWLKLKCVWALCITFRTQCLTMIEK